MQQDKLTSIRLSDDDRALIADLKQRYGATSMRQVIRLALRMLADRSDIALRDVVVRMLTATHPQTEIAAEQELRRLVGLSGSDDDDGSGSLFVEVE